jgi:SagB-type dehydrogenase family enzyme
MTSELGLTVDTWKKIQPLKKWPETVSYAQSVFSRRSKRNFIKKPLPNEYMTAVLEALSAKGPNGPPGTEHYHSSLSIGFIAERVDGFDSGVYLLDALSASYGMIKPGLFMEKMAHICLDQAWLAGASIHFLFMTNLKLLDRRWGARGYRYAMMSAGRLGERLYLCATAMGIGCCGIGAFYDPEASALLSLNDESRLLYLVALGQVKK